MSGNRRKLFRQPLILVTLFLLSLYAGVALFDKQWSEQARFLVTLLELLLTIVICAAALLGIFKLIGRLWNAMVSRRDDDFKLPDTVDLDDMPSQKEQE